MHLEQQNQKVRLNAFFQWSCILTYPIQSANSKVFGTVADSNIIFTWAGNIISTSSHTTPLCSEEIIDLPYQYDKNYLLKGQSG